jgi:two-component system NarL family sensor kinase
MTTSATVVRRVWPVRLGQSSAVTGALAVLAIGVSLMLGGLLLALLVEHAGVSGTGFPTLAKAVVHVVSEVFVLPLAALMLARLPRHPIGWILCAAALGSAAALFGLEYATYSHFVHPLPLGTWAGWAGEWVSAPGLLLPAAALLLFPGGTLPSRRWTPMLWCGILAAALITLNGMLGIGEDLAFQGNPLISDATARSVGDALGLGWALLLVATIGGVVALVRRRESTEGDVRQQVRLLAWAAGLVALGLVACAVAAWLAPLAFDVGAAAFVLSLAVLASAMAVAILRYRLYGLDVYVNRALVLTGLTIVLGSAYVVAVVVAGRLLGQGVELGVALPATALVAIAFLPVRDWLQRRVNRLLHGQRDEPYAAISTLGRRLGETIAPADVLPVMVDTIADSLRLPYVAVELADAPGVPAAERGQALAGVALRLPLVHAGERVGTLVLGARAHGEPLGAADRRLLEDFARRASAAASAIALTREVQHARERLVTTREEERRRLRGDLHDGLGPTLAGAVLTIDAARRVLAADPTTADALLDQAAATVESTVADVRRLVYGLRPPALDQLGLVGALRQQASMIDVASADLGCEIVAADPFPPLPAAVEVAAYRIAQEALTNVARHADARHARVSLSVADALRVEIEDDGRGMPSDATAGVGLTSMRERAGELGGSFEIVEVATGGTLVRVQIPIGAPLRGPAPRPGPPPPHDQGAIAHGTRDALGRIRAHVAGREDAWTGRLEEARLAVSERPAEVPLAARGAAATEQVARRVDREHPGRRLGAGVGADHHEDGHARNLLDAAVAAVAKADGLHRGRAVHGCDLGLGHDLDPRRALDAIDEVLRHRRLQRLAAHHHADAARPRREVDRRLPCRVPTPDDDHVRVTRALRIGGHRGVIHPRPAEALDAFRLQLPPACARGDHDAASNDVLAVVEVDPEQALGAVGELDRAVEARQHRVEATRLECRLAGQVGPGDPDREAEVVLDPGARSGLSARGPCLGDERPEPLRAPVHGSGKPGRAGPQHDEVEALPVDVGAQPERACDLGGGRVAHHLGGVHQHRGLRTRDVEPVEQRGALGVRVHVVPAHREEVALEQVSHLERSPGAARSDEAHDAVPLGLVPRAPGHQRAEDQLAELRPARDHVAQRGPVELDHVGRLDGDARAHRRLAGEDRDVADERAAVGLRDVDVLAGLAVDELDQPAIDDEEWRVADGVLVEHLTGLEGAPLAVFGEPGDLAVREPREEDLVREIGKLLAANNLSRGHERRLPRRSGQGMPTPKKSSVPSARTRAFADWTVVRVGSRRGERAVLGAQRVP